MIIIAIDLGKFNSMACICDTETQDQQLETLATERGFFRMLFNSYSLDLVVVEACGPSGWVSDLCGEMELPILVCSTHEDAWSNVKPTKTTPSNWLDWLRSVNLFPRMFPIVRRPASEPCRIGQFLARIRP